MRTKLELWKLVKENFDEYFKSGLCVVIGSLWENDKITADEYYSLDSDLANEGNISNYFLGKKGDPKPRLEFIEKMIKKHSK
jgi:hypothetical protein